MESHYKIIISCGQIGFKGSYAHVSIHGLLFCMFGVVLANSAEVAGFFRIYSHIATLHFRPLGVAGHLLTTTTC